MAGKLSWTIRYYCLICKQISRTLAEYRSTSAYTTYIIAVPYHCTWIRSLFEIKRQLTPNNRTAYPQHRCADLRTRSSAQCTMLATSCPFLKLLSINTQRMTTKNEESCHAYRTTSPSRTTRASVVGPHVVGGVVVVQLLRFLFPVDIFFYKFVKGVVTAVSVEHRQHLEYQHEVKASLAVGFCCIRQTTVSLCRQCQAGVNVAPQSWLARAH